MTNTQNSDLSHFKNDNWHERFTSAFTLITVGIVLLLNTTGTLSWSVWWEFIKFWPLFIISAGISLILSFNQFAKLVGNIIGFLIFVMALFFAAVNSGSPAFQGFSTISPRLNFMPFFNTAREQDSYSSDETVAILKQDYEGVSSADVTLESGIGYFSLSGFSSDNSYASVYLLSDGRDGFNLNADQKDELLNIDFSTEHSNRMFWSSSPKYYFDLANDFETIDLSYKIGAGQAELNFNNSLNLDEVKIDVGAGEIEINIAEDSTPTAMELTIGAGDMLVKIPKTVAVRIEYNVGVGNIQIDRYQSISGLGREGTFTSDNWDTATNRILIKADVGVGKLEFKFN